MVADLPWAQWRGVLQEGLHWRVWKAGGRDARQLWAALRQRGSRGRYPPVACDPPRRMGKPRLAGRAPRQPPRPARRAAWLVRRREA
jgi:hypothetical protein